VPDVIQLSRNGADGYQASQCAKKHGNFISASYQALTRRKEWRKRLAKVHSGAERALPKSDCVWKELDSSMSSEALLMNIFSYPGLTKRRELSLMLGTGIGDLPEFGFKPRIPLTSGFIERTEIDMKHGSVSFEAKLTEADVQNQDAEIVEGYRDLEEVFEVGDLPRRGLNYVLINFCGMCWRRAALVGCKTRARSWQSLGRLAASHPGCPWLVRLTVVPVIPLAVIGSPVLLPHGSEVIAIKRGELQAISVASGLPYFTGWSLTLPGRVHGISAVTPAE
jgi:hypothetical protein